MTLRISSLLTLCAAFLLASAAEAQVRPSNSIYILLRGGVSGYNGDLDGESDDNPDSAELQPGNGYENPGFGFGGEIGYQFSPAISLGLAGMYHDIPALNDGFEFGGNTNNVQGGEAYQGQLLLRLTPFARARLSPYIELGGAIVSGQGTENEDEPNGDPDKDLFGYGPVGGLGLDFALTPQFGIFLGGQATLVFPDAALDGANPGAFGVDADNADYDWLTTLGGGLRYAFRPPYVAARITSLECPAELEVNESGSFMAMVNDDATRPVTATWQWGDGSTGSGATTSHAYSAAGTYTVTAMVMNDGGEDSRSCLVTVTDPPTPPRLAGCRATPSTADAGETITVNATATDADRITVDFGDGTTASSLPARHAYAETGTYSVTITATNQYGSDTCTIPVTVGDSFCAEVTELNPVFFGYGSTTLTADAQARLDENIEVLRRCPDICVTVNAYSDGAEPGDPMRVSQARADAVVAYYVAQGVDRDRLRAIGLGVDPSANPKEDPGPGDSRARRADSIPSSCAGF